MTALIAGAGVIAGALIACAAFVMLVGYVDREYMGIDE